MPIPKFDTGKNVLPPHLGNPSEPQDQSPFTCTMKEFVRRFSSSRERKKIIRGFLKFRKELFQLGFRGFQWLGGSFVERIEQSENRDPHDIDVVTWVKSPGTIAEFDRLLFGRNDISNRDQTKQMYRVDHFIMPLGFDDTKAMRPEDIGESIMLNSTYWISLLSHTRESIWKGILRVELNDESEDSEAIALVGGVT